MSSPCQNRPYQGYPYSEPAVIDAPSITADQASRWQHLPRRPVQPMLPGSSTSKGALPAAQNGGKTEDRPVIYINIPEDEGRPTASGGAEERRIEIAAISEPVLTSQQEDAPVVCLDMPETTNTRPTEAHSQSHFVEETIFYNPFEDRRIDMNKNDRSRGEGDSTDDSPTTLRLPTYTVEPTTSQDLHSPQSSIPPLMSKEAYIYTQPLPVDDGLRLSPLPVSSPPEYPEPPPAYTELDERRQTELPRTQVVVSETSAVARGNANRKLILCPYCGRRVLTLVVRESGILTHVLGTIFLIACFPLTICIYCTDWCKYRNHYCPQCNNLIAYEVPILCQDMVYNKV